MLLETSLVLIAIKLSQAKGGCTDTCAKCVNAVCLSCLPGYHGTHCHKLCSSRCKNRICFSNATCNGCLTGSYGSECEKNCHSGCKDWQCGQWDGHCFDGSPDNCLEGTCSVGCDGHCNHTDDKGYPPGFEERTVLSSEQIVFIALGTVCLVIICFCCLIRTGPMSREKINTSIEIVPPSQRLLPGQQPDTVTSNNGTHSTFSLGNGCLESESVMTYPSNGITLPGNTSADVTPYVTIAEIQQPIPSVPPPHYDSLFKAPVSSSGDSFSPQ